MTRFVDCAACRYWVKVSEAVCLRCGHPMDDAWVRCGIGRPPEDFHEIAAGVPPPSSAVKVAGAVERPVPAADPVHDLRPHCALGAVSFGPRWTVRGPEAAGAPIRLEGDGVALALDIAHAADLHAQLALALLADLALRAQAVQA